MGFPKAFATTNYTETASDNQAVAHSIHSDDGDHNHYFSTDSIIDTYIKDDDSGGGQMSLCILIIKNTGDTGSNLTFNASNPIFLSTSGGTYSAYTSAADITTNTGFTICTQLSDFTCGSNANIITPAEFSAIADYQVLTSPSPYGYFRVDAAASTTVEAVEVGGTAVSSGGGVKYIPIYKPSDLAAQSLEHVAADGGGTTPEYCAIAIKYDPTTANTAVDAGDNVTLQIITTGTASADAVSILLTGTVLTNGVLSLQYGSGGDYSGTGVGFSLSQVNATPTLYPVAASQLEFNDATFGPATDADMNAFAGSIPGGYYPYWFFTKTTYVAGTIDEDTMYYTWLRFYDGGGGSAAISYHANQFAQLESWDTTQLDTSKWDVTIVPNEMFAVSASSAWTGLYTEQTGSVVSTPEIAFASQVHNPGNQTVDSTVYTIQAGAEHWYKFSHIAQLPASMPFPCHLSEAIDTDYFQGFGGVTDNWSAGPMWRPHALRLGFKFYAWYDSDANNSGTTSKVQMVTTGPYSPYTTTQQEYAEYGNTPDFTAFADTVGMSKKNVYDEKFVYNSGDIRKYGIINKGAKLDDDHNDIIQPLAADGSTLRRNAIGTHTSPSYTHNIPISFHMLNFDLDSTHPFIADSNAFYCNQFKWVDGVMYDSASTETGTCAFSSNDNESWLKSTLRNSADSADASSGGIYTGFSATQLPSGTSYSGTNVNECYPSAAKYQSVLAPIVFSPKAWKNFSFYGTSNIQAGSDAIGRNVYSTTVNFTGGVNGYSETGPNGEIPFKANWLRQTYNALAWPEYPELRMVVTDGGNVVGTVSTDDNYAGANIKAVSHSASVTSASDLNWYPSSINFDASGADIFSPGEASSICIDLGQGADNIITKSAEYLESGTAQEQVTELYTAQQKALSGSSIVRTIYAWDKAQSTKYQINPHRNIQKNSDDTLIQDPTNWPFVLHGETKLNTSKNRYECFIPLNFAVEGDHGINILDVSLIYSTGSCDSTGVTFGSLPTDGASSPSAAKAMAPAKVYSSLADYKAATDKPAAATQTTDNYTLIDGLVATGNFNETLDSFCWGIVEGSAANPDGSDCWFTGTADFGSTTPGDGSTATGVNHIPSNYWRSRPVTSSVPYWTGVGWQYEISSYAFESVTNLRANHYVWNASEGSDNSGTTYSAANLIGMESMADSLAWGWDTLSMFDGENYDVAMPESGVYSSYMKSVVNGDGTTAASEDMITYFDEGLFKDAATTHGYNRPMIYFAVNKADASGTDALGVTAFHTWNRMRVRYIRHIHADVMTNSGSGDAPTATTGQTPTPINTGNLGIYEAYVTIKVDFAGVAAEISVEDVEGDAAENQGSSISFGNVFAG
jgi:hypothetical protein